MTDVDGNQPIDTGSHISVITHPTTRAVADEILVGLGKLGLAARIGQPEPTASAVVLVLSRALLETAHLEDLTQSGEPRLVPVTVQRLDGLVLPDALARLNWIPWNPAERGSTLRMIASACTTDLEDFHALQLLIARAEGWVAGGRLAKEVANTPRLLHQLQRGAAAAGFEKLPAHAVEFLNEAARATRSQTLRRRLQGLAWCVMAVLLVWSGWNTADTLRYVSKRQQLDLVATSAIEGPSNVQMVKLAGLAQLQLNRGERPAAELVERLIQTLATPSAFARFQKAPSGMLVNAIAFGPGDEMLLADGEGSLWKTAGSDLTMEAVETRLVTQFVTMAAVPDLSSWVAASPSEVLLNQGGRRQKLDISGVENLKITPDGRLLGALTEADFEAWQLGPEAPKKLRSIPRGEFLGSGIMHGQLTAVLHDDQGVVIVDAATGDVRHRLPEITSDFSMAAVGEGGEVTIQGADHRLWLSYGESFFSLGVPVQDIVSTLIITPTGQLIYASRGGPTHMIDLHSQAKLQDVCTEAVVETVTLSPDGRRLACDYGSDNTIWELSSLIPTAPSPIRSPTRSASAHGVQAWLMDSSLIVAMSDGTTTSTSISVGSGSNLQGLLGRPVTLALSQDGKGLALGSDAGDALVVDISPQGTITGGMQWRSPDGSAVRSLQLSANKIEVYTTTGTWTVPACVGCTIDTARLLGTVRQHLMACYLADLTEMLGRDVSEQLGLVTCAGE